MLTLIKRLFCRHSYQEEKSRIVYGDSGPSGHTKESVCLKCLKIRREILPL